jgi:hypothetical protein
MLRFAVGELDEHWESSEVEAAYWKRRSVVAPQKRLRIRRPVAINDHDIARNSGSDVMDVTEEGESKPTVAASLQLLGMERYPRRAVSGTVGRSRAQCKSLPRSHHGDSCLGDVTLHS